ncbi:MAG TPA: aminoglycoside phosphotransferase family protein [Ktedonobacteraceae bacterium]|nr:aminoglycoside phosphotransferase family protein [Ktedonobacteraceae bacterium]
MQKNKRHADELDIDIPLVRRLLAEQFPQWADLPLKLVLPSGTDHAIYRLGDELSIRLPRIEWASGQGEKEWLWLPRIAPHLPLDIPVPLAQGKPGEGYPWSWSIYRWLPGENAMHAHITDDVQAAHHLARFITALQRIDPAGWPEQEAPRSSRGVPLAKRDKSTREAIAALDGMLDTDAVMAVWEAALQVPAWQAPPVWIHSDLSPLNLLVQNGRLSAVIDFGGLGIDDPACEMIVAWSFFTPNTREIFRAALQVDNATWARGRGWALSIALIVIPYYQHTNPVLTSISRHVIDEILAEHRRT